MQLLADTSSTEALYCLNRNAELSRAVKVSMEWAKIIYILVINVNKLFFFFS